MKCTDIETWDVNMENPKRENPWESTNSELITTVGGIQQETLGWQPWSLLRLHTVTHMLTLFDYNFVQNNSMYTLWFSLDILWTLYKYGMFQIHLWIRSLLQISIRLLIFPYGGTCFLTNSPFTPVWFVNPTIFRHAFSFSIDNTFVSISDPFSSVWIFTRANSFSSTLSLSQWYCRDLWTEEKKKVERNEDRM